MEKFTVNVYYTYVATVEVEAESIDNAYDKGYQIAERMPTNQLEYVGHGAGDVVIDSNGEYYEMP